MHIAEGSAMLRISTHVVACLVAIGAQHGGVRGEEQLVRDVNSAQPALDISHAVNSDQDFEETSSPS